ncbi:hypothetical protein AQUCO_00600084v1 [Aquilegia coerulea]|uniref:Serpin domain-containing protein n=1 Tax=Aquilegia coerulea TaxID=218851 RepID=A0A2G5EN30_AQUCA|nr:hypothetical protein AQUCO_00600084v1 [Aquilegia coerulea]
MAKNYQLREAKDKNFVFPPCSVQLALSLLANGSNCSTLKEFLAMLEAKDLNYLNTTGKELTDLLLGSTDEEGPQKFFLGGVWIDKSYNINLSFKTIAENIYQTKADFLMGASIMWGANNVIVEANRIIKEATHGLIKNLLGPNSLDTRIRLLLANALYFKGTWYENFDKMRTKDSEFYLLDGNSVQVPFMTSNSLDH